MDHICIARYVYGVARYVYGVARYESDIQCKVSEIHNNKWDKITSQPNGHIEQQCLVINSDKLYEDKDCNNKFQNLCSTQSSKFRCTDLANIQLEVHLVVTKKCCYSETHYRANPILMRFTTFSL